MNTPSQSTLAPLHRLFYGKLAWPCSLVLALTIGAAPNHTALAATAEHSTPADHGETPAASKTALKKPAEAAAATEAKEVGTDLKAALKDKLIDKKSLTLLIKEKPVSKPALSITKAPERMAPAAPAEARAPAVAVTHSATAHAPAVVNPQISRAYSRPRAAPLPSHEAPPAAGDAHAGEVHWSYEGENGPQAWGKLKPEFNVCAIGKRQSPINIEDTATLQGPAEPLQFNYTPSNGVVVNNGHTIQVDLNGDNTLTARGSVYKLIQFHFHTPSEEQVNYRSFAMVAHLVHKNPEGQLAVVAVLLESGAANPLINTVWTYMPLDMNDRVRTPPDALDMKDLLPKDQRYYQFIGSLTTPPCTEGVLWMVLKQPTQLSREQIKLFQKLFPNNARPVQPINGRPVRDAQ